MWIWIVGVASSLGLIGTIVALIMVPGIAIPLLQQVSAAVLKCKPCLALLAAIALLFVGALYGVHVERARAEARIETMRQAAAAAAQERDAAVKADLERKYQPRISALEDHAKTLQDEVAKYAKPKAAAAAAPGACKLGAAPLRLRQLPSR